MNFLKKLFFGGSEKKPTTKKQPLPSTVRASDVKINVSNLPNGRKPTINDLFYLDFKDLPNESGEITPEFTIFKQMEVIKWAEYPLRKNIILKGKCRKKDVEEVARLVNSLVYLFGKDSSEQEYFGNDDKEDLEGKYSQMEGYWGGRWWQTIENEPHGVVEIHITCFDKEVNIRFFVDKEKAIN